MRLKRRFLGALLAVALCPAAATSAAATSAAAAPAPSWAADRVLLTLEPAAARAAHPAHAARSRGENAVALGVPALDRAAGGLGVRLEPEFRSERPPIPGARGPDLTRFWIAHLPDGLPAAAALAAFADLPGVARVDPIAVLPASSVPDDSLWRSAWHLSQPSRRDVHALEAWEVTRGDSAVLIAILDTGCLLAHPDLGGMAGHTGQFHVNRAERDGAPGFDDDGNGIADDWRGWDFVALRGPEGVSFGEDWRDEDDDPNDFAAHGTAVAGVAAALTDNHIGIAGAAPGVHLLPVRIGWSSPLYPTGQVDMSFAARGIRYAVRSGAAVINCSFASVEQPDLVAALESARAAGVVVVAAAGNNGSPHFIAEHHAAIGVAATDAADRVTAFSNRGGYVDLAAPGLSLPATTVLHTGPDSVGRRQAGYTVGASGTSFSAPLVSAAAALMQSQRRALGLRPLTPGEVAVRLRETADDIAPVNPDVGGYGAGRLDMARALTDPPRSYALETGARSVGPAVVLTDLSGRPRIASVLDDGRFVMMHAAHGDLLVAVPLPGPAAGGLAAARLAPDRGLGFFVALADGRLAGLDASGGPLDGWPVPTTPVSGWSALEPSIGDLDADGAVEVVWGGDDGAVHVFGIDGRPRPGFPRLLGEPGWNVRVALADLDRVPGLEIVATTPGGHVHALDAHAGTLPGWPAFAAPAPLAPLVARLAADGSPVVVVAGEDRIVGFGAGGGRRFEAFGEFDRSLPPLAAGDLDGDGLDEIVVAQPAPSGYTLALRDTTGALHASRFLIGRPVGAPVIGGLGEGGVRRALCFMAAAEGPPSMILLDAVGADWGRYGSKHGDPGIWPTLADPDADGATEIVAGGTDSLLFWVYDAGPGSAQPSDPWPTPGGDPARTGSRFGGVPLGTLDDVAPPPVADLVVTAVGPSSVSLRWTAPSDVGPGGHAHAYDLRWADAPIDAGSFERATPAAAPVPHAAADTQQVTVGGLAEGRAHWFALRSRDDSGNWSPPSEAVTAATAGGSPSLVADLAVVAGRDSSLTLRWTAPADDGRYGRPRRYHLRFADRPFATADFDALAGRAVDASSNAGEPERATLVGLDPARRWWVALKAEDEAGQRSPMSNTISSLIGPLAGRTGVALAAAAQPARTPVRLSWQADVAANATGEVLIFDLAGRRRRSLPVRGTGGTLTWDGADADGRAVPAGLYFAELASGAGRARARIVLLR